MDIDSATLVPRLPVNSETFNFHGWTIVYEKSHILHSMCTNERRCQPGQDGCCELCFYEGTLDLPHLPEMVFPKNRLTLTHNASGAQIDFNTLDALRGVQKIGDQLDPIQVSCAEEWQGTRPKHQLEQKVRPYDWTFSTDYQGTLNDKCRVETTDVKLDIFKLMRKEAIHFYHDLTLFEDELHDHGIAQSSVKIRVMPSGFFILLRYFLRIDNVLVRINDTRFHYEIENPYILKEYTSKEARVEQLRHVPPALFTVPSEIEKHLPVLAKSAEKLFFAAAAQEQAKESVSSMEDAVESEHSEQVAEIH